MEISKLIKKFYSDYNKDLKEVLEIDEEKGIITYNDYNRKSCVKIEFKIKKGYCLGRVIEEGDIVVDEEMMNWLEKNFNRFGHYYLFSISKIAEEMRKEKFKRRIFNKKVEYHIQKFFENRKKVANVKNI